MLTLPTPSDLLVNEPRTTTYSASGGRNRRSRPCFPERPTLLHKKDWALSQALTTLLLLGIVAPAVGQEVILRRAEPVERMRERQLENERWRDPDYDRKVKAAEDRFNGLNLGPDIRPEKPNLWKTPRFDSSSFGLSGKTTALRPRNLSHEYLAHDYLVGAGQIRDAQQELANLGYLDPKVDVDGKIGPRTRQALSKFQREHGLIATGTLDLQTELELNPHPWMHLRRETDPLWLRLNDLRKQDSHQYQLHDKSGSLLFEGVDHAQLGSKLNELLSRAGNQVVYLETSGFSQNGLDALVSSLRIRQHQIDTSVSLGVVSDWTENPARDEGLLAESGLSAPHIRLEYDPIAFEKVDSGEEAGKIGATLGFTVGVGRNVRRISMRILAASLDLVLEFLEHLGVLRPAPSFDENLSLAQLVGLAREDMKKTHPGLTDKELQVMTKDQSGKIELMELYYKRPFAWC